MDGHFTLKHALLICAMAIAASLALVRASIVHPAPNANPVFFDGTSRCGDDQTAANKILTTFNGDGTPTLKIGFSHDGINWCVPLIQTGIVLRDPALVKIDSTYYIAATTSPGGDWLCLSSPDGKDWGSPVLVDTTGGGLSTTNVWAPTWFVDTDGSIHVFSGVSEDNATTFQTYDQVASGTGNICSRTWSNPTPIDITSEGSEIDPWVSCIDSTGIPCTSESVTKTYYLFYNDFPGTQIIFLATASTLAGPYTIQQTGNWAGWQTGGHALEGPNLISTGADSWRMYYDDLLGGGSLTNGQQFYSDCTDGLSCFTGTPTWTAGKAITTAPFQAKHGAVYPYP